MSRRTILVAVLSSLVLGTGACDSTLELAGPGIAEQPGTGTASDNSGIGNGQGADDPAGDDRGGNLGGHGADDPPGDDHGGGANHP